MTEIPVSEPYEGVCWNCGGDKLIITPDPQMQGVTDMIICLECGEMQLADGE